MPFPPGPGGPQPPMGMPPGPPPDELMALLQMLGGIPGGLPPGMGPTGPQMPPLPPELAGMPPELLMMLLGGPGGQGGPPGMGRPSGMTGPDMMAMTGPEMMGGGPPGFMGAEGEGEDPLSLPPDPDEPALDDEVPLPEPAVSGPLGPKRKKKPKRRKPTEEWVKAQAERAIDYWRGRDQRMDEDLLLYRLSRSTIKGDGPMVLLNTPFVVVEKGAALLSKQRPNIDVVSPDQSLRPTAQRVEDYCRSAMREWNGVWTRTLHGGLLRDLGHFQLLRGWTAVRIEYDPEADPKTNPIRFKPEDPRQLYPVLGKNDIKYLFRRYTTTVDEMVDEWPAAEALLANRKADGKESDGTEQIEVTAYYDDWYHCVWCDYGTIKTVTPHEYGFLPWRIAIGAGSPVRHTDRNVLTALQIANGESYGSSNDWTREVGVSVYHGIRDAYDQLNGVLSLMLLNVQRSADPPLIFYHDPSNPDEPKKLSFDAGTVNYLLFDRERVEPLRTSPNPTDYGPLIDALNASIRMGTFNPELWGVGAAGSGLSQTLMAEHAEDVLTPYLDSLQALLEDCFKCALTLIRDFHDDAITFHSRDERTGRLIGGGALTPEDIGEVGTEVLVNFRQVSPRDRMAMARMAIDLTREKLISMETARDEYLGLDNPARENERVLTDMVYLDEEAIKALVEVAIKRSEPELHEVYQRAKERAEKMAQQQGPPQGGPPGPPQPPPPPPGVPPDVISPNEQAAAQDPMFLLNQAIGSGLGGASAGPLPPGFPG